MRALWFSNVIEMGWPSMEKDGLAERGFVRLSLAFMID